MAKGLVLGVIVKKEGTGYSAWCPELDVASQGKSIEEARKNLKEAVEVHVQTMIEMGDMGMLRNKTSAC
ncbi:MAG TPA: type II toxin-antitoxin system HicB family antitoxin [Candidatus Nanoarchaeia archaeon]|nr:type II toxin-antitoxin system HicB family antitoxin [Candidatus Nanoarchaeia archaeon]